MMKLGFIGTGNMAGAIMGGIIQKGIFRPEQIIGADISEAGRRKAKETYGIEVTEDNRKGGADPVGETAVLCGCYCRDQRLHKR